MKKQLIITAFTIFSLAAIFIYSSCNKATQPAATEEENMVAALAMDAQIANLHLYHDSTVYAHMHNPGHQHHYDSIFHHHDSIYHHHHHNYHHGDTTPVHHHHHDSLINAHHNIFH
jgi:hypothetical protein